MGSLPSPSSTSSPKYTLHQAKTRAHMDTILDIIWAANYSPYDPLIQLFFPIHGYDASAQHAAVTESKARFWDQHCNAPHGSSNWYYVSETATGKAVGCAQWEAHSENPFGKEEGKRIEAGWWPEGEYRAFCESVLEQVYRPRASWMGRGHLALNWMCVLPAYRGQGIGSLLMSAGVSRADALGLECWMEATQMGKRLYEKHGFRSLVKIAFDMDRKDAGDLWRKAQHELTPPPVFAMWRPKLGVWEVKGRKVTRPWDLGVE
ncbi:hypothetical protein K458DRAFT_424720 [Lentithecium fluviatile CBS 122367]|uniref:N-acetyltransferase domain-containing protein n=1 Tax=Lentithecium fluviatile CBS 122367 TaxID=1168545 RepID=A0A6G1IE38_9PLEO|nr:hypothetical protein K458DRAFT_424720 [Lentithecium fluviatile CBS 122367]